MLPCNRPTYGQHDKIAVNGSVDSTAHCRFRFDLSYSSALSRRLERQPMRLTRPDLAETSRHTFRADPVSTLPLTLKGKPSATGNPLKTRENSLYNQL
jgi:hypothetical protein